ncbi:MAG: hypothetical protein V4591_08240 [Bdellovibrionota bacterium]
MEKLLGHALEEQVKHRTLSYIAEGVGKFPKSVSNSIFTQISGCTQCPLYQSRKRVLVSPTVAQKKFFVLSEFPTLEDENSQSEFLYAEKSPSGLIVKLLEKLSLLQDCHFSFALKCVPEKGIPATSLSTCAKNNLKLELHAINPEVILCFGSRSLLALAQLEPSLLNAHLSENSSVLTANFGKTSENHPTNIYFLSSSGDLQAFPHWRSQVWRFLEHFKTEYNPAVKNK